MIFDVAVVGRGPAGATAATRLALNGLKVVLIEKNMVSHKKPCGGGLTPRVFRRFPFIDEEEVVVSSSHRVFLHSPSLTVKAQYSDVKPLIRMVLRTTFDKALAHRAVEAGVKLVNGEVRGLDIKRDAAQLYCFGGEAVAARVVVAADGVVSKVAREAGLQLKTLGRTAALCAVGEYEVGEEAVQKFFGESKTTHLFPRFNGAYGYGWVFPKLKHVNVGFGCLLSETKDVERHYCELVQTLMKKKLFPHGLERKKFSAGLLPVGGPHPTTFSNRIVVCGDAAGFVNPLTGEGIYYAIVSGELASKTVTEAVESGECGKDKLSEYQEAWMKDFGDELRIAAKIQKKLYGTPKAWEIGVKLASVDKNLMKTICKICIGEQVMDEAFLKKIYMKLTLSTGKYVFERLKRRP